MTIIIKKCKKCGRFDRPECPNCIEEYAIFPKLGKIHCFYCGHWEEFEWAEEE